MKKWEIISPVTEYEKLEELDDKYRTLVTQAKEISESAYAPYSNFKVGAAILLENGKIVLGNNQENAAYPSGLCAERVAMFYANANYPDSSIEAIAICAQNENGFIDNPVSPCGSCRQVLLETENRYKKNIRMFLIGEHSILEINKIKDTLPLSFDATQLK